MMIVDLETPVHISSSRAHADNDNINKNVDRHSCSCSSQAWDIDIVYEYFEAILSQARGMPNAGRKLQRQQACSGAEA